MWFFSWASVIVFVYFSMADLEEQRVCIKSCFLLAKTAAETVTMLREAFKEEALSQARVYKWFSQFKRGDMSLEDKPRSGRPSTSRTDENIKKSSRCDNVWSSLNNQRVGSIDWSFVELMSTNFNRTPWTVAVRWVASASRQCSRPHRIKCAAVSYEKRHDNGFASPLPPGPGTLQFFPVSKNEEGTLKESVFRM